MRGLPVALATVLAATALTACDDGRPAEPEEPRDAALTRTDSLRYTLRAGPSGWTTTMEVTFTNRTGAPVYVGNCNGITSFALERWTGAAWVPSWSNIIPLCLSPPIPVATGADWRQRLAIFSGYPGRNSWPRFTSDTVDGTYRLVWASLSRTRDDDARASGLLPLAQRTSNAFELVAEPPR